MERAGPTVQGKMSWVCRPRLAHGPHAPDAPKILAGLRPQHCTRPSCAHQTVLHASEELPRHFTPPARHFNCPVTSRRRRPRAPHCIDQHSGGCLPPQPMAGCPPAHVCSSPPAIVAPPNARAEERARAMIHRLSVSWGRGLGPPQARGFSAGSRSCRRRFRLRDKNVAVSRGERIPHINM